MSIIVPRNSENRVVRSFRLKHSHDEKLSRIAEQTGETKTYVLESLLEYAIKAYEKEKRGMEDLNKKK